MATTQLTCKLYRTLVFSGLSLLSAHAQEVNDLNVFPIPDGDTGTNMQMTLEGGVNALSKSEEDLDLEHAARVLSGGMLLGARGNSGVILSQFFGGITQGFIGMAFSNVEQVAFAFQCGVKKAYSAVVNPTEGTILTVARETTKAAVQAKASSIEDFLSVFLEAGEKSLENTPNLLKFLKDAGVVDSGAKGLLYIVKGMLSGMTGDILKPIDGNSSGVSRQINPDLFTSDMEMKFGYCTEILLRLQESKCDIDAIKADTFIDYFSTIGNSIVCFKTGSIIKAHVHTFAPYKVLEFSQKYGEFLTIKIENMMLQNGEVEKSKKEKEEKMTENLPKPKERHPMGVVTVATGAGIRKNFLDFGVDAVINGGQTMNPSSEDFIKAFDLSNAETIFVLPNNGNVILAANQAASLYKKSKVIVIPTKNLGQAYSILGMLDLDNGDEESIQNDMLSQMDGVLTVEVSKAIRPANIGGHEIKAGDYLGILGKDIESAASSAKEAALQSVPSLDVSNHVEVLVLYGKDGSSKDAEEIAAAIKKQYPDIEVQATEGDQDIYDYLLIAE
ncbi:MAG: DAK2 domain-containing protein [Bacilli bacterium]